MVLDYLRIPSLYSLFMILTIGSPSDVNYPLKQNMIIGPLNSLSQIVCKLPMNISVPIFHVIFAFTQPVISCFHHYEKIELTFVQKQPTETME